MKGDIKGKVISVALVSLCVGKFRALSVNKDNLLMLLMHHTIVCYCY